MSILLNTNLSVLFFDMTMINAAPADKPDVRNKGPRIEVFHKGLALKADNKMPVYIPRIIAKIIMAHARYFL